ncbi:hypothetical protein T484DRAFT_1637330 [Baffinella frigidus]|nr:hypothetical protein T484DRAFT_1637330 [Cryptophyta sp. CCMP2293]
MPPAGTCVQCRANTYSTAESGATSSETCSACPTGKQSPSGSNALAKCSCAAGYTPHLEATEDLFTLNSR